MAKHKGDDIMTEESTPEQDPFTILRNMWLNQADLEAHSLFPKVIEYGSRDLMEMGHTMARAAGRGEISDEEATEYGIYWYALGKMARWTSAVVAGKRPSDDTLLDLGVYARMAQHTRQHGGWPWAGEADHLSDEGQGHLL